MPPNVSISEEEKTSIPPQHVSEQIQRIIRSETFKGSEVLRHLLEYLGVCFLNGRTDSVKVKEIARDVFGRSESFDSQTDSVVRVHTGRLRSKLAEYYMEEGSEDELILGIPKGGYSLAWHQRKPMGAAVLTIADSPALEAAHSRAAHVRHPVPIALAGAARLSFFSLWLPGSSSGPDLRQICRLPDPR
jgi:hypothetical protein